MGVSRRLCSWLGPDKEESCLAGHSYVSGVSGTFRPKDKHEARTHSVVQR